MAVYRPTWTDKETGETRESRVWWMDFWFDGKRIRKSAKTTRKTIATEAEKDERLRLERARNGMPSESIRRRIDTVRDALATYAKAYAVTHRPKSIAWVKERSAHLERLLGSALKPDVTEERIGQYIADRLREGAGNRTVNMEAETLARAFGGTWRDRWPSVKKLWEPKDTGRALSADEEAAILAKAAASRSRFIHPFVRIALSTAMRSDEIRLLRWRQVDLDGRSIRVGVAKSERGTGREIPINAALGDTLAVYREWYAAKVGQPQPDWFVFPFSNRVKPVDPLRPATTIKSAWERVRDDAGVACRFHDLRHTALTKLAEAGTPEGTMLAIAGHMSRAMLERYSHIRIAAKRTAVEALSLPAGPIRVKESPQVKRSAA